MIVIADTTPLNYLIVIGCIDALPSLYTHVIIPSSVQNELLHANAPVEVRDWMSQPPSWMEVRSPLKISDPALLKLDAGKRDAIALAEELNAQLLIVDELKGRRIAEERGLAVVGTIGVLRDAASLGLIDIKSALDRLSRTTFHLSPGLVERLVKKSEFPG